jgi:hypothetical protein
MCPLGHLVGIIRLLCIAGHLQSNQPLNALSRPIFVALLESLPFKRASRFKTIDLADQVGELAPRARPGTSKGSKTFSRMSTQKNVPRSRKRIPLSATAAGVPAMPHRCLSLSGGLLRSAGFPPPYARRRAAFREPDICPSPVRR